MYDNGGKVLGAIATPTGILVLPNTGGNTALLIFSILSISVGVLITASFAFTRIASLLNK